MRLILLFFFCFVTNLTIGQNFNPLVLAGISTSQVSADDLSGFNKLGLKIGLGVTHRINNATRGELSLYYLDKGSKDSESKFKIDLSYIESCWSIQKSAKGFIYEAGLQFAVLIDGATYDIYGFEDISKSSFNRYEVGGKVSAGVHLMPQIQMFWEISNTLPFWPIQEHPNGLTFNLNRGKYNSIFSISFRYLYREE